MTWFLLVIKQYLKHSYIRCACASAVFYGLKVEPIEKKSYFI